MLHPAPPLPLAPTWRILSPTLPALLFTADSVRTAVTLPHLPVLFSFSPNTSTHPIAAVALSFLQLPFW